MRDFPIFEGEYGVSSLFLKEIPYKNQAFIRIRAVTGENFSDHLKECVSFCRMAGAEEVFAADDGNLEKYPLYTSLYEMSGQAWVDREKLEHLFPVTEATVARWRKLCNERLRTVPCAATLTPSDEKEILSSGGAYFVHHEGELLGIGWLRDLELAVIAAVKPGAGERVMHTLMSLVEGSRLTMEVASNNTRAIALYERLGFLKTGERTRWYRVFGEDVKGI